MNDERRKIKWVERGGKDEGRREEREADKKITRVKRKIKQRLIVKNKKIFFAKKMQFSSFFKKIIHINSE